jgi:MtN3 and saliva related transmembrane protein
MMFALSNRSKRGFGTASWNCNGPLFAWCSRIYTTLGEARGIITRAVLFTGFLILCGCQDLVPHDTRSLLIPRFSRSEIFGFVAGLGTTFAAVPDLIGMLKRRSSAGMNPRMATITGVFQILWVYYGLLIASRPVIAWNVVAVVINFLSVGAYRRFARKEKSKSISSYM